MGAVTASVDLVSDAVFGRRESWLLFIDQNGHAHDLIRSFAATNDIRYKSFPLRDVPENNPRDWLKFHADEHKDISRAFGLPGPPDLSSVDLLDERQFYNWMLLHRQHHRTINKNLGLT